jgi:hypothetical protein
MRCCLALILALGLQLPPALASDACSGLAIKSTADVTVSDGSEFRTESFYRSKDGASDFGLSLGGYVMGCAHLSNFRLMPEVGLSRSVAGAVPVRGWTVNLGLGFAWQRDASLRSLGNDSGG